MDRVRWGIIGCGDVCEVKSGPALQRVPGSSISMVMRRDAAKCAHYAARHGVPRWTTDAAALIADPEVDAVYIATPVGTHLHYALQVAAAGKPCLVEKPMARSHAECTAMNAAFTAAGAPLFVAFYRRRLPWFVQARELLDAGRLGTVTSVQVTFTARHQRQAPAQAQWRLTAAESGGGLFLDLASHTLDLLDYLLGPVAQAEGFAVNRAGATPLEDGVALCLRFASGVLGTGTWDFASDRAVDAIQIHGTAGRLSLSTFGRRLELCCGDAPPEVYEPAPEPHVHQGLVQTVVDALLGRGVCPSTGESAARTAAVMDRVLAGYYGGRDDAFWERPETWPGRP